MPKREEQLRSVRTAAHVGGGGVGEPGDVCVSGGGCQWSVLCLWGREVRFGSRGKDGTWLFERAMI